MGFDSSGHGGSITKRDNEKGDLRVVKKQRKMYKGKEQGKRCGYNKCF